MDKDVKELLEWFKNAKADVILPDFVTLDNLTDKETILKIFNVEQMTFISKFAETILNYIEDWHNKNDVDSHKDIRKDIKKFKAQFRNHRHNNTESYSGKAEY